MSKTKSNVNPGHYKVAGRERQGEDIVHDKQRAKLTQSRALLEHQAPFPKRGAPVEDRLTAKQDSLDRARHHEAEGEPPSGPAGESLRAEGSGVRNGKRRKPSATLAQRSKARRVGTKTGAARRRTKTSRQRAVAPNAR